MGPLGAEMLLPAVVQNAVKPGAEPIRVAQLMNFLQAQGQGFLHQIVCQHGIATPGQGHPEQTLSGAGDLFSLAVSQAQAFN
jgi:hypothetical protein